MNTFRIPLRVVFYREQGRWVAHCLEFDLCGDGTSKQEALRSLVESVRLQVEYSVEHDNPKNLFSPAPSEIQEKFFAGTTTGRGELQVTFAPVGRVVFEDPELREYVEDPSGRAVTSN